MRRLLLVCLFSSASLASTGGAGHRLEDSRFQYPALQKAAFVETQLALRQGAVLETVPDVVLPELLERDVRSLVAATELDFSLKLTDRLGLLLGGSLTGRMGLNVPALVLRGASVDGQGEAGLAFRLWRGERSGSLLSVRALGGYASGQTLNAFSLIGGLLALPGLSFAQLQDTRVLELVMLPSSAWQAKGGLYFAQALGTVFNLQASLEGGFSRETARPFVGGVRVDRTNDLAAGKAALALGVEVGPLGAPLALQVEYAFLKGRKSSEIDPTVDLDTSLIGGGVYYAGRDELQLGLSGAVSVGGERVRVRRADGSVALTQEPTLWAASLVLRYFW